MRGKIRKLGRQRAVQVCMNYSADVNAAHDTQLSQSDELQIQSLTDHYIRMLSRMASG